MTRKYINIGKNNISEKKISNVLQIKNKERNGEIEALSSDEEILNVNATNIGEKDFDPNFKADSKDIGQKKSKTEKVKEDILRRYQERNGKQLYIRLPHKVPDTLEALEEEIKKLTPLVIKVHKPRQRHARFCLVDFSTKEDRDNTLNKLKKKIKQGKLKKYAVNIPRTESSDFVVELAERKMKSIQNKKAKLRFKNATKKSFKENSFTSTIIVLNLPKTTSTLQIRELFRNAVDINIKPGKGKLNKDRSVAAITFPTTMDARNAAKMELSLGGNQLSIKFDNKNLKMYMHKDCLSNGTKIKKNLNQKSESKTKELEFVPIV